MPTPERRALPASDFLAAAARAVLDAHRALVPDLSTVTVLIPGLHAAQGLARELAAAAALPALLLPRITTLEDWVATVPVPLEALPDSRRELILYGALRGRDWLHQGDLWHVAGELRALCDELTRHRVALPASEEDLLARLEAAYGARPGVALQFEARLVREAWQALGPGSGAADAATRRHLQLRRLADAPPGPLVAAGLGALAGVEREFFEAYALGAPVLVLEPEAGADPLARLLECAWPGEGGKARDLRARAGEVAAAAPRSPAAGRIALFGASSLEQEARAADARVRTWLLAGRQRIAVVAQDRLAARRLRALLERAEVRVQDETGWTLSTVAAATVLMRLLDCVAGDFYHQDFLDLLKSPLVFGDLEPGRRKATVYALERLVRARGVVGGLAAYRAAAEGSPWGGDIRPLLKRLEQAQRSLRRGTATVGAWLDRLGEALDLLGVGQRLAADAAGQQLLELLARKRREVGGAGPRVSSGEWRRWLERQLEADTFRDREVASPVILTHLAATRLRAFDAVVLLGCDAAHFPPPAEGGLFFNQGVRRQLGLPLRADELEQARQDLVGLLARSGEALVTWQRTVRGEENLLSPWFELLDTLHRLAYGASLQDPSWAALTAGVRPEEPLAPAGPVGVPAPAAPGLVPRRVSVSAYGSLVACPYQFFARHMLKLNELDEVREEMEKRDYGQVLHEILKSFHDACPRVSGRRPEELEAELAAVSERHFAPLLEANYLASAWLLRWRALIPAYLEWQRRREEQGWRYQEGEARREAELPAAPGGVVLHGRLDRVDRRDDAWAVLDYKTQAINGLRQRVKEPGEDVQLVAYALLQGEVAQAAYLSLNKDRPAEAALPGEPGALARQEQARFAGLFGALLAGAGLPANGGEAACARCEMQGLCRRAYWA
jgi:ATP-dependent helicase/nuclease subunit B